MIKLPFIFLLTFYVSQSFGQNQQFIELDLAGTSVYGITINYRFQKKWNPLYISTGGGLGIRQGDWANIPIGKLSLESGFNLGNNHQIGLHISASVIYDSKGLGSSKQARDEYFNSIQWGAPFRPTFEETYGLGLIYRYQKKKVGIGLYPMLINSYFFSDKRGAIPFGGFMLSYQLN